MRPAIFALLLALLGITLTATVVPAAFTIDEANYLVTVTALRHGGLTVPGTAGLTPSPELFWFDPQGPKRRADDTPVSSVAPPLYAPLAVAFSFLGWRGLVLLNTVAFLLVAALVFAYARRHSSDPSVPWLAATAFALGGYALEYAQGLWPHMLAAALCTAAFVLAARVRDGAGLATALLAGGLAGLAAGVRYQNFFLAACIGLGVLLWAPRRWRSSIAFAAGTAVPLALSAWLNHLRVGSWNPISKGAGYLAVGHAPGERSFLADAATMAWARVVDFSARPSLAGTEHASYLDLDPATGAYYVGGAMKKAWLQSAPWIGLALVGLLAAWIAFRRRGIDDAEALRDPASGTGTGQPPSQRRELKAISLVVFPVLGLFAAAGVFRTDGLGFNQRYFIELVPLAAVAFAWSLDGVKWSRLHLLAGALVGSAAALAALVQPAGTPLRSVLLLYLPLLLAAALVAARALSPRTVLPAALAAAALAWSLCVHLGDDVAASRNLRRAHLQAGRALAEALPERSALVTWWGAKDAAVHLLLERDLVVIELRNDRGADALRLVDDLRRQERPAFLLGPVPSDVAARLTTGVQPRPVAGTHLRLYALDPTSTAEPAP